MILIMGQQAEPGLLLVLGAPAAAEGLAALLSWPFDHRRQNQPSPLHRTPN